jgi:hypothetical protein
VGYCAKIAHHLIAGSFEVAAREAASMSLWDDESRIEYDIDNELIEPSMLAIAVLSNQVLQLLPWWTRSLEPDAGGTGSGNAS